MAEAIKAARADVMAAVPAALLIEPNGSKVCQERQNRGAIEEARPEVVYSASSKSPRLPNTSAAFRPVRIPKDGGSAHLLICMQTI